METTAPAYMNYYSHVLVANGKIHNCGFTSGLLLYCMSRYALYQVGNLNLMYEDTVQLQLHEAVFAGKYYACNHVRTINI